MFYYQGYKLLYLILLLEQSVNQVEGYDNCSCFSFRHGIHGSSARVEFTLYKFYCSFVIFVSGP